VWLTLGGRRVDTSASYRNQRGVGQAIQNHRRVNRSDVFVTSKVGPYLAMGFDETKAQVATMLDAGGLGAYVDLVLIHWPSCAAGGGCSANTTTPACGPNILGGSSLVCNGSNVIAGDVSHYMFADGVHPTPFEYSLVAKYVAEQMILKGWL